MASTITYKYQTDELLFQANAVLAAGNAILALELYTKVLYTVCPGHPMAFLNRSLAYVSLGYPELAVTDAYRARIVCHHIRYKALDPELTEKLCRDITRYMRCEKKHIEHSQLWTTRPHCFIGRGWLANDLSCITLRRFLQLDPEEISWDNLLDQLELRATYRMAGAMGQIGLGANHAAMDCVDGVVNQRKDHKTIQPWNLTYERPLFRALGDQVLRNSLEDLDVDREMVHGLRKSKLALVNRVIYPWDTYEPDMSEYGDAEKLELFVDKVAPLCTVRTSPPTTDAGAKAWLLANEDINPGEIVISEKSVLQVTTAPSVNSETGFYCDSCAALMIMEGDARPPTLSTVADGDENDGGRSEGEDAGKGGDKAAMDMEEELTEVELMDEEGRSEGDEPMGLEDGEIEEGSERMNINEPTDENLHNTPDFHHCSLCLKAAYCSTACFIDSDAYHARLCGNDLEEEFRGRCKAEVWMLKPEDAGYMARGLMPHPKVRCLHDLFFLRLVSMAADRDTNVLSMEEVKWLGGDLRSAEPAGEEEGGNAGVTAAASSSSSFTPINLPGNVPKELGPDVKRLPWTYLDNVAYPLDYFRSVGVDPLFELERCDGWVVNTLWAKIYRSGRITEGVRHEKRYDGAGKVGGWGGEEEEVAVGEEEGGGEGQGKDKEGEGEGVWVGSLHPVLAMVGLREGVNVEVREGREVKCVAVGDGMEGEGAEPCIFVGERIVRALGEGEIVRGRVEAE